MVKHGNRTSRHCFSKKVGIASKAHDLVGEALIIFSISSSVAVSKANSSFTGLLVSTSESSCWSSTEKLYNVFIEGHSILRVDAEIERFYAEGHATPSCYFCKCHQEMSHAVISDLWQ